MKGFAGHQPPVYLDWAATAPLRTEVWAQMEEAAQRLQSGVWANPSSVHAAGRAARSAREIARAQIASAFRLPAESLIFTSGGTEALALAIGGTQCSGLLVGATEHAAVRAAAPEAAIIPVDPAGLVDVGALEILLERAGPKPLVAIAHANNETGVVQDIATLAAIIHAAGGLLLVDSVQSAGKLPLPLMADMLAFSAHKLGGPAGIGALAVRCKDSLRAVQRGGGQESGYRGGTENLLGIIGFAAACTSIDPGFPARAARLQQRLELEAIAAGAVINGAAGPRLPSISSIHLPGVAASTQLMALDMAGIAVSQGAACSSGTLKPSETLLAMGLPNAASQSLRISTGWSSTDEDIDRFLAAWRPLAGRAHAA